jgi:hypothetical protein
MLIIYLSANQSNPHPFTWSPDTYFILLAISTTISCALVFFYWYYYGRYPKYQNSLRPTAMPWQLGVVTAEFMPPDNLPPAVLGVLEHQKVRPVDKLATLIDLVARGYVSMELLDPSSGNREYRLKLQPKPLDELYPFERTLLSEVFKQGDEGVYSNIDTFNDVSGTGWQFAQDLYQTMTDLRLTAINPTRQRDKYYFISIIGGFILFFIPIGLESYGFYYLSPFVYGLFAACFALLISAFFTSSRTLKGQEIYQRSQGYKLFIRQSEKYRQKYLEQQQQFSRILPYAMVFGVVDKYVKDYESLGFGYQALSQTLSQWWRWIR